MGPCRLPVASLHAWRGGCAGPRASPRARWGGRRHEQDRFLVSLKARFLRLYPAQSDIPVSVVKKNPLKQIFLTKKGGEKGVFNADNSANPLKIK
jgi:hypothetical protein